MHENWVVNCKPGHSCWHPKFKGGGGVVRCWSFWKPLFQVLRGVENGQIFLREQGGYQCLQRLVNMYEPGTANLSRPPVCHTSYYNSSSLGANVCLDLCCKSCLCTKLPFEWIQVTYQACLKSWISFFLLSEGGAKTTIASHMHGKRTADRKY